MFVCFCEEARDGENSSFATFHVSMKSDIIEVIANGQNPLNSSVRRAWAIWLIFILAFWLICP